MDCSAALDSIARMLSGLPDESLESMLVTFDALVGVADQELRPEAARMLQEAAATCADYARRVRLSKAADDVAASRPCALTPEGLTAQQAAAAATTTDATIEDRLPPPPGPSVDDEDEDDDAAYMEEEPPKLPHLPVRYFFPGLVVRVGRDFRDANERAVCEGELLKVFANEATDDGHTVMFLERNVPLKNRLPGHVDILENAGNSRFQPVPTVDCLQDLSEAIDVGLTRAAASGDYDSDEEKEEDGDSLDLISAEVAECLEWLSQEGERGTAPQCRSARLAATTFGPDHALTVWVRFLFAAIEVCTG